MSKESISDAIEIFKCTNSDHLLTVTNQKDKVKEIIEETNRIKNDDSSFLIATSDTDIYNSLDVERIKIFFKSLGKISIIQHAILRSLEEGQIKHGEKLTCFNADEEVIILRRIDKSLKKVGFDRIIHMEGMNQDVLERMLDIAIKIGRSVKEKGRTFGAFFIVGDSDKVLKKSRQLIINAYKGHGKEVRNVRGDESLKGIMELIKLDGSIIVTKNGYIRTAGTFVETDAKVDLPSGLGSRHTAAAAITKSTNAISITVSKTDGNVRVFKDGNIELEIDPNMLADY